MSGIRLGWGKFNPSRLPKRDAGLTTKAGGSLAHSDDTFFYLFYRSIAETATCNNLKGNEVYKKTPRELLEVPAGRSLSPRPSPVNASTVLGVS